MLWFSLAQWENKSTNMFCWYRVRRNGKWTIWIWGMPRYNQTLNGQIVNKFE